jgi:hypothetical protein
VAIKTDPVDRTRANVFERLEFLMAIKDAPQPAANIMAFAKAPAPDQRAATLDYGVPLPGQQRNRRIVQLTDVVNPTNFTAPPALDLAAEINLQATPKGDYTFDQNAAVKLWFTTAAANGVPGDKLADLERWLAAPSQ